jgi:hypothetical protein
LNSFPHIEVDKLLRKIATGDVALPLVRMEKSQKTATGVHVADLAMFIDGRREAARKGVRATDWSAARSITVCAIRLTLVIARREVYSPIFDGIDDRLWRCAPRQTPPPRRSGIGQKR